METEGTKIIDDSDDEGQPSTTKSRNKSGVKKKSFLRDDCNFCIYLI